MAKRVLVLHGPNLNLLGEREGREGGRLADLDVELKARAKELGLELTVVQSNHEGVLLDTLHARRSLLEGVVVSPSSLFGSYPLRDALEAIGVPAIAVYLEDLGKRTCVVSEACLATLEGEGFDSYFQALERFASGPPTLRAPEAEDEEPEDEDEAVADEEAEDEAPVGPLKTLGRKPRTPAPAPAPDKTLGRKPRTPAPAPASDKTLGRKSVRRAPSETELSRELVRSKIADRLSGRMSPSELSAWARSWWTRIQSSPPAETEYRELLEESLRRLTLATFPASRMSDSELVELMTRLDG
ncbi:MAG: type II 3-dehydroquinate dehydratase [Cystobacter sp.]